MTTNTTYRQACRRSHRLLGTYLAMTAWVRKVDCVILSRAELLPYLGVGRMKNRRVDWLKADVGKLVPNADNLVEQKTGKYSTLYLSRLPFPEGCFQVPMSDQKRMKMLNEKGFKTAIVEIPQEAEIVTLLATTIHGLRIFPSALREPAKT